MAGKLTRGTPFGYRARKTALHTMPAGLKLVFVIIISAFSFVSIYGLAASILLILLASVIARIPPPVLLKGSKTLVIMSLCVILLKTITPNVGGDIPFISVKGFFEGLLAAARIFVPFASAALLFSVTTTRELRLSLALVEKSIFKTFFHSRKHIPFFSLGVSLMLGFIPRFFELWDDANLACDSRSCKKGLRRLPLLLPLVTERMMEACANTALALESRAFGSGETGIKGY
jgi:biotin transport system permease protein